jgi:hypothetical protein
MDEPADRSDLIVGTMRPPAWVTRIPPLAWPFLVLAVVGGWLRVLGPGSPFLLDSQTTMLPVGVAGLVIGIASLLLPVAVLVGPTRGESRRALLFGAVALALGEVLSLLGAVGALFVPAGGLLEPDAMTVAGGLLRALFSIAAPAGVLAGLRWSGEAIRGSGWTGAARTLLGLGMAAAIVQLLAFVMSWAGTPFDTVLLVAFGTVAVAGAVGVLIWTVVAATALTTVATAPDRADWRRLARATVLVAVGQLAGIAVGAIAVVAVPDASSQPLWSGAYAVAFAVEAVGMLLLVRALATGPRPVAEPAAA